VPLERDVLAHPDLKPWYERVTWLFVNRSFAWDKRLRERRPLRPAKLDKAVRADLEALRTHDRFGISSWPQMVVFDPRDDRVLAVPPRSVKGLIAALERGIRALPSPDPAGRALARRLEKARALHAAGKRAQAVRLLAPLAQKRDRFRAWAEARELLADWQDRPAPGIATRLDDPDAAVRAIALESLYMQGLGTRSGDRKGQPIPHETRILERLTDENEDVVVRIRALWCLGEARPALVTRHAAALLAVPNDPLRYRVLDALAAAPDPEANRTLIRIFREAGGGVPSKNPNVLRIRVARVLGKTGDGTSVPVLAEVTRAADPRNALTGIAVDALGSIAGRLDRKGRRAVVKALLESVPPAVTPQADARRQAWATRIHLALVRKIAAALRAAAPSRSERLPPVPSVWSPDERERYVTGLKRAAG
jgi:HEAT repeat protein